MKNIYDFILNIIEIAGGTTIAAFLLCKFGGKWFCKLISEMIVEKYKAERQKSIEKYKIIVGNVQYVTHKRYDKEFDIYSEMTNAVGETIINMIKLIPVDGNIQYPLNMEERKEFITNTYKKMVVENDIANSLLYKYKPFISDEIGYTDLLVMIENQIAKAAKLNEKLSADFLDVDDYNNTKKIMTKYFETCNNVKKYLLSLEII